MVRQEEGTTRLLPGHQLDSVRDHAWASCAVKAGHRRPAFTHDVDPEEVRQAAEEDYQGTPEA
jgi:hypothetical protein